MSEEKSGLEQARETAQKLKDEKAKEDAVKEQEKAVALTQLAELSKNSELAKMYSESAQVGAENLAGELPLLKVHSTGRSTKNDLADGTEPSDGSFFYKPNREEFKAITCHILTISKGFRAAGIQEPGNTEAREVFNQIVGGVIVDGKEYKPFIMYFTGLKLSNLWDFGKKANKYTHAKPIPIPMFALTVQLSTEKIANKYGKSWVVNFEIKKSADGSPELVMDPGEFQFLKDHVSDVEDTIASLIATKTKENEAEPARPLREISEDRAQEVADDIPF
jgi:hypothetical protein